jgi:serine/threonine protein kinase
MAAQPSASDQDFDKNQETTVHDPDSAADPNLAAAHSEIEGPGTWIGPYKLIQQIGEGGMGAVYMAEQEVPVRRRVALKLIKGGVNSAKVVARFEAERQALALMDHLNIARVLDAGATAAGLPYFVMELIDGVPLTKYCDDHRLTSRQRLELFAQVCHAIQHAHQKGIIHRDIKPANILVTEYDDKPVPKVIDFGVAKATEQQLTDRTLHTQYGAVVGSLEYMSPEQAEMSELGIDTRSDVYSLGVVLYELLTGSTPLGTNKKLWKAGFADVVRMIQDVEPPRPSTHLSSCDTLPKIAAERKTDPTRLRRSIKGDLDWVVMKCLEKDRTRRYESASALARDVEHYLADEPVEACPPSATYRMRRFARKHKGSLAAATGFILLLIAGLIASMSEAMRANRAEQQAHDTAQQMQTERDRARLALTQQVAQRLDGDWRRLAMAGQVLAATLAQRTDWKEADLENWMRTVLGQDERIFGMALAFEPRQFDQNKEDYCIYLFRGLKEIEKKYLLPPSYLPLYREWEWYKKPVQEGRALWSEPYVDTGGGEIPMVTYTTPIRRGGQLVGVLTLDLSVQYLEVLRGWLKEVNLGGSSYGFVISPSGIIISHPHGEYDLARLAATNKPPRKITELSEADPSFTALIERMQHEESGSGLAIDPATGKPASFLFARVPSAGWTFVAVIDGTNQTTSR